jgi:catechol 2,3-dioxygenase-like lactoylglutathione lyase family enzyme
MSFRVDQIDHVELLVRDPEASARWYAEILGLREVRRWEGGPIMIGAGLSQLALFQAPASAEEPVSADAPTPRRWRLVAWKTTRSGFEAAQQLLFRLGIPFRGPIDHEVAWSIYFEDPDGHPLELTYYV